MTLMEAGIDPAELKENRVTDKISMIQDWKIAFILN